MRTIAERHAIQHFKLKQEAAMKTYSYDEKCEELARHFLAGDDRNSEPAVKELAQAIQDAVENWLEAA